MDCVSRASTTSGAGPRPFTVPNYGQSATDLRRPTGLFQSKLKWGAAPRLK